jgi:hypothetical protein
MAIQKWIGEGIEPTIKESKMVTSYKKTLSYFGLG